MTETSLAREPDSALPRPYDLIYPRSLAASKHDPIAKFGDAEWPVRFFSANPSMSNAKIKWDNFAPQFREHLRLATWCLFNVPLPDEVLRVQAPSMRSTLSARRIYHTAMDWRLLGRWLDEQGVTDLRAFSPEMMANYAEYLRSDRRVSRNTALSHITAIKRLWVVGEQLPILQLAGIPPWFTGNVDDYLPARQMSGENVTTPIDPASISALLHWAMQMIHEGTEPVLAASDHLQSIERSTNGAQHLSHADERARLREYFKDLMANGLPVPSQDRGGTFVFHNEFIAYKAGCTVAAAGRASSDADLRAYAETNHAQAKIDMNLGPGASKLLPSHATMADVVTLIKHLRAACFIVISYLTGMRPGEVLGMESGMLAPSSANGGWELLRARTFKTAVSDGGNHNSTGERRQAPWIAVAPVVEAIRTLERLHPNGLLFPSPQFRNQIGRSISHTTASDRVDSFIEWINEKHQDAIPDDPSGRIRPVRFRRTLAWHIANQPGGLVALAVQYGHLHTAISEGYATRSRDGIKELIDFETARSVASKLSEAHEAMEAGQGTSGPSAMNFANALREQNEQFGGIVTSKRQAQSLLRSQQLAVFQNEKAFLWCNFRPDTALCLSDRGLEDKTNTPRLDNCKKNCVNIARTDDQAEAMRQEAERLKTESDLVPRPIAERLESRANVLLRGVSKHNEERRTLGSNNGQD